MHSANFLNSMKKQYEKLQPFLPGMGNLKVRTRRHQAIDEALKIGTPHPHQPTWKYALLQPLFDSDLQAYLHPTEKLEQKRLAPYFIDYPDAISLVFVNGYYAPYLSHKKNACTEMTLTNFGHLADSQSELLFDLINQSTLSKHFFPLLNDALVSDGALIIIPDNTKVCTPIFIYHLLINDTHQAIMVNEQAHIFIGKNSQATIIEKTLSVASKTTLFNTQTFIKCDSQSQVNFFSYASDHPSAYHFSHLDVHQFEKSNFMFKALAQGANYHRLETDLSLMQSGAQVDYRGLMLPDTSEHIDWISRMHHHATDCHSEQTIKAVVGKEGHSTFLGNITVKKEAQKTIAHLHNHNLLLSKEGKADTAPQLEILADDVKCNHGATVGHLETDALFYLRSRGINEKQARKMLIDAFVQEIFGNIESNLIQNYFQNQIHQCIESMIRR